MTPSAMNLCYFWFSIHILYGILHKYRMNDAYFYYNRNFGALQCDRLWCRRVKWSRFVCRQAFFSWIAVCLTNVLPKNCQRPSHSIPSTIAMGFLHRPKTVLRAEYCANWNSPEFFDNWNWIWKIRARRMVNGEFGCGQNIEWRKLCYKQILLTYGLSVLDRWSIRKLPPSWPCR